MAEIAPGLLGNPFLNIGAGLLSVAGPSFQPQSLGQGLQLGLQNLNQGQQALLQNRLVRSRLAADKRKREAAAELRGLLSGEVGGGRIGPTVDAATAVDAGMDPTQAMAGGGLLDVGGGAAGAGDPRVMGLLAEIAPEQVASQMVQAQFASRRPDSVLARLSAAGIDPQSDEGRDLIKQSIARGGGSMEELDGILKALNIKQIRQELAQESRDEARDRRRAEGAVVRSISALQEMAEINNELEGTALETGAPLPEIRRAVAGGKDFIMEQLGFSAGRAEDLAAKVDRFEKLATQEVIRAAEEAQLGGTFTNQQLQTFMAAKPGTSVRPDANRKVIADMLEESLRAADANDIKVKDREKIEALLRRLRGQKERRTGRARPRTPRPQASPRVIPFDQLPE